jgi:tetratricopeptide (TPR) repeat protein
MSRRGRVSTASADLSPASAKPLSLPEGWLCALIFVVSLLAYLPALRGGFLWDDAGHVTRPELRSLAGLYRIWFEIGATQQYYPLLHSAFWVEHRLWGDAVAGYHGLNIALHATAACLFGRLLRRLAVPGAALAALLFALHPVCVESVAWISEQKNTLSAVFYLTAALAYLNFDDQRGARRYAVATAVFLLALLTKTVTATLPAALLVVFWWRRGRLEWRRDVLPLLPWFALGAASGLFTAKFERELIGAQGADFVLSGVQRVLLAGRVFWFYLGKLFWPAELVFIYPRWTVDAAQIGQWLFPLGALALLGGLGWRARRQRGPLAAVLLFGGTLFPVLGFFDVFPFLYSYVADHFQYLASLAIFALIAAGLTEGFSRVRWAVRMGAAAVLLATLGALTWSQARMYRDVETLYRTTLERNPACWMAHNNLAIVLADNGRVAEAISHLETTLALRPDYAEAENNLGDDLNRLGRSREAIPHLERALRLQPGYAEAHNNLGVALLAEQRTDEGIAQFAQAIRAQPAYAVAHYNWGLALARSGRPAEALPQFERAVALDPGYADAELSWGLALMLSRRFDEAVPHFERALALKPDSAEAQHTYGRALAHAGRWDAAIAHYRQALRINPDFGAAHLDLALALRRTGRIEEAQAHYIEAQRLGAAP